MTRHVAIFACLALAGCVTAPAAKSQVVELGAEVTLAAGATVSVKGAGLAVRFVSVTEDSRCPRDVTCIWAGEVKIQLEVLVSRTRSKVEILEGGNTVASGYRVSLVRVDPVPSSTARIALQDYRVTLRADKAG